MTMPSNDFDQITDAVRNGGIDEGLARLADQLRSQKKYHELFEVLKMQLRQRLGLPLWYQDATAGRDADLEESLERGLLKACEEVGYRLLDDLRIREAWVYLRPVGDRTTVAERIRRLKVNDDQIDELIEVTVYEGVDPPTGFSRLLERYGTCNAITTFDATSPGMEPAARQTVAAMLVRHIYREVVENVRAHMERELCAKSEPMPSSTNLGELCSGRDWLTADGSYHVDTSHLSSVVRCARAVESREVISLARDLAEYGARLDPTLQYPGEEPFVDTFPSHIRYFNAVLGKDADASLAYFRERAEQTDTRHEGTMAAEVYVDLLARIHRIDEAVDASIQLLPRDTQTRGVAPTLLDLCRRGGDYSKVAQLCREQDDLLGFATALLHDQAAREAAQKAEHDGAPK